MPALVGSFGKFATTTALTAVKDVSGHSSSGPTLGVVPSSVSPIVVTTVRTPLLVQSEIYNQPSENAVLYGAFPTQVAAQVDAERRSYTGYGIITRGEWYSYHARFGMDLVCSAKSGIWAVSGLIGGG